MFQIKDAYAHCDIPCKIYDPAVSLIAALSVVRLTDILLEIGDLNSLDNSA